MKNERNPNNPNTKSDNSPGGFMSRFKFLMSAILLAFTVLISTGCPGGDTAVESVSLRTYP